MLNEMRVVRSAFSLRRSAFTSEVPMASEITMPQQSDTMTQGTIVKWLKKEGDAIKTGQIIAEIETDKATMEMEAFESGTLAAILVGEGKSVAVGTVLAVLAKSGEKAEEIRQKYASGAK